MPLRDHFHSPLVDIRHWHSFHNAWATYLAENLNSKLPPGYFAEPHVQFGIEIDVATLRDPLIPSQNFSSQTPATASWTPPAPTAVIDFPFITDIIEVLVFSGKSGPELAGAIELVSPANKDRPSSRDAFVAKCRNYLQQALGLVIVDTVTSFRTNLHHELLVALSHEHGNNAPESIYCSAYRVVEIDSTRLQVWNQPLQLMDSLPTLPLWLGHDLCLAVDLETTYERTCQQLRIPPC
jgi:hypothetical protein